MSVSCAILRTTSSTSPTSSGSSEEVISSSRRMSGRRARVRADRYALLLPRRTTAPDKLSACPPVPPSAGDPVPVARFPSADRPSTVRSARGEILSHGHMREEVELLEHHSATGRRQACPPRAPT